MKKNHLKIIAASFLLATTVTLQSCSNNDDDPIVIPPTGIALDPNNFQGEIKNGETVTLDPSKIYKLTGAIMVKTGGRLVIPAGTRVEANGGTSSFITVEQGGQLYANGTATSPVVFTSNNPIPGAWGGIVLCGKAPGNKGNNATAEVGNATYGGTIVNDNSGALTYVRIEYAGALHHTEKEFNGLSLFGVGNGTKIDNISIINGSDDGIEFFGGTVNVSNIILVGNEDDAFDWTEGWNGTATNIFSKRRTDGTGNRGIEADNNSSNNNADPRSNPTIKNATFIGTTSGESDGLKLREGTYGNLDNIVLSGWKTGINIEHDASVAYFNGGGKITNINFVNVSTESSAKATGGATVEVKSNTFTKNNNATGAGNGINIPTWAAGWSGVN